MGLLQRTKAMLGIGKRQTERLEDDKQTVSDAYPDTPDGTYRCVECGGVYAVERIGGQGIGTPNGEFQTVLYCPGCSTT